MSKPADVPFCFGSSSAGRGADVVIGMGAVDAIDAAGAYVVPFVSVVGSVLFSPFVAGVGTGAGSVLAGVDVVVVAVGLSVEVTFVSASFDSNRLYSTGGWEVERRLASVGVSTSAMLTQDQSALLTE